MGKGEGVLIMTKNDIYVEYVQYGTGMAEVLSIAIKTKNKVKRRIIVAYVPPKTNTTWRQDQHREMQKGVLKCLDDTKRKDKNVQLVGDFYCINVDWEEIEDNGNAEQF